MKWGVKLLLVIVFAVVITALGIDASDTLRGSSATFLASVIGSNSTAKCPIGMQYVASALTFSCVDSYEAAAGEGCPYQNPATAAETTSNILQPQCKSISTADSSPWRFITREQAVLACVRAGKRLPKSEEWYQFALGTTPSLCNLFSQSYAKGTDFLTCTSTTGAYQTVGNVWEWVTDDVIDGQYNNRTLPSSGYVTQVDSGGVATETSPNKPNEQFSNNYFWSESVGAFGMIRGGFYGSGSDGGVFAVQAATKPTFTGTAIGFRCVQ